MSFNATAPIVGTAAATTMLPGEFDQTIHLQIKRDRELQTDPLESVCDYRKYTKGEHGLVLTDGQRKILQGLLGKKFCENLARKVIAEARDRLKFMAWECEDTTLKKWLDDRYTKLKIAERSGKIHFDTLRDGNHAVAVNWDNTSKTVRVYREPWWDGNDGIFMGYDATDAMVYAVKDWVVNIVSENGSISGTAVRRVVWFEDRFERWISSDGGNSFSPFLLPGDNGVWPQPWVKLDGTPLHIPYVHFKDSGQGEDTYGTSELHGGVLGLIDQVQDTHYVLSGAGRMNGYQIITATGIELAKDENEKEIPPEIQAGLMLWSKSIDAKFGRIEPGDPEGIIKIRQTKLQALASSTATPLHAITGGDWPSGEALMRAEQPSVGKADTQAETLMNCWSAVGHKMTEIQNRFGSGPKLNEDLETAMVSCRFAPTERRDPLTRSIIVMNLGERISNQEGLRIMGYTDSQAAEIVKEKQAESREAAQTQAIAFSRGVGVGTGYPGKGSAGDTAGNGAQGAGGGAGEGSGASGGSSAGGGGK